MNHGAKKALLLFYRVIWYLPMIYFIAFWPFYFRAWMTLGHAPVSRLNDPKYYGLGRQHDITIWFLLAVFCSFLVCFFIFFLKIFMPTLLIIKKDAIVFGFGVLLSYGLYYTYSMEC